MEALQVKDIVAPCKLEVLSGGEYLERAVTVPDINRPGLLLAGYMKYFDHERVQVLGRAEWTFLNSLGDNLALECWTSLVTMEVPCIIFTRAFSVPPEWLKIAGQYQLPVLRTSQPTTRFIARLTDYLERCLAPKVTIHGVFVDVHGIGVLLTGESGIGKSETALELVKRGHRLVADDAVEVIRIGENTLQARSPDMIRHLMEIRGLGILDIKTLFGAGAVRLVQEVYIAIHLEEWQNGKYYDRLGLDEEKFEILGVSLPRITIPVRPGRNLSLIVELAAMNYRLKSLGYHSAQEFLERHDQDVRGESPPDSPAKIVNDFSHDVW